MLKRAHGLISKFARDDPALRFAVKRKIDKELMYDERSKPAVRVTLNARKWEAHEGRCVVCKRRLPDRGREAVLDRFVAMKGYTDANTR